MPAVATPARRRSTLPAFVALVLGLLLAATGCSAGGADPGDTADTADTGAPGTAAAEAPRSGAPVRTGDEDDADDLARAAIDRMLLERARAVLRRDRETFLATVDDRDPRTLAQQRTFYENLAQLPLVRYDYETTADQLLPDPVRGAEPDEPVLRLQTIERVRVADALTGPVGNELRVTYVRRDGRWLVGREEEPERAPGDGGGLRPWFGEPVEVAGRGGLVVLADAADEGLAATLAAAVASAVTTDAALLQVDADDRVLVDATSNQAAVRLSAVHAREAAAIYTDVHDLDAQGRLTARAGGAIRVNPDLTAAEIVADPGLLRHEVVHLLLRRYAAVVPLWLSEGVAEYARWYPLTTPDLEVDAALARRLDRAPRELPGAGTFQLDPAVNYLVSQAAAQHLFALRGATGLRALLEAYREGAAAGGGTAYGEALTSTVLVEVYGTTEADVVDGAWAALGELDR